VKISRWRIQSTFFHFPMNFSFKNCSKRGWPLHQQHTFGRVWRRGRVGTGLSLSRSLGRWQASCPGGARHERRAGAGLLFPRSLGWQQVSDTGGGQGKEKEETQKEESSQQWGGLEGYQEGCLAEGVTIQQLWGRVRGQVFEVQGV
jgi:hypothetical protein